MSRTLAGRHALVTGGGRGIGAAIARALSEDGARLTLIGRNKEALEKTAGSLAMARVIEVDVVDPRAVNKAFELAGAVDILVNNAGAAESAPVEKTDEDLWNRMLAVNLTGSFHCIKAALPAMRANGFGRIVNVASTAGLKGYAYVSAYCAAKHGLVGLTRAIAAETARDGITVNAVCPGYAETDMLAASILKIVNLTGRAEEAVRKQLASGNPQGRFIQPEEVAACVSWLCSSSAGSVTGQAITIDGGEIPR